MIKRIDYSLSVVHPKTFEICACFFMFTRTFNIEQISRSLVDFTNMLGGIFGKTLKKLYNFKIIIRDKYNTIIVR